MQSPASSEARRWRVLAVIVCLVLAVIGMALVLPGSLPYPANATYSDAQVSHWPNAIFLRQSVLEYQTWPFWNPMRMLGQPFAANPLSKVWYPPQWLVLIFPPTIHLDLLIYLHLAWLGLGMVMWLRSERRRLLVALFMALAWGLNPKLISHIGTGHLDILYALSWVPWVLLGVNRMIEQPGLRRGALLGVTLSMLALGDVRIAAYFIPVAVVYALLIAGSISRIRSMAVSGLVAFCIFALLTAVQWVPLISIGPLLTRASLSPQDAAEFSLPPYYLIGLLVPDLGGQHEWMTALGLPVILLALYALRSRLARKQVITWWVVVIIAALWAFGNFGPLFLPVLRLIPALTWLRVPSRAWFVVAFAMVVLAGYGLDALLASGPGRWGRLAAVGLASAGVAVFAAGIMIPGLPGVFMGVGATLIGCGAGLWIAGINHAEPKSETSRRARLAGAGVLFITLIVSLVSIDTTFVIPHPISEVERPEKALIAQLDPGCTTIYSPTFDLIGPAATEGEITTLHGVDPFELQSSAEMIAAAAGVSLHGYSVIAPPMPPGETDLSNIKPRLDLLRATGVCNVVSSFPIEVDGLDQITQVGETRIYRLASITNQSPEGATQLWQPHVLGFTPVTTRTCTAEGSTDGAVIMIPQSWAPGWHAWLDGQPVEVHKSPDSALINIRIESAGCHTLALAYRPQADLIGLMISGVTALLLASWWLLARRRTSNA